MKLIHEEYEARQHSEKFKGNQYTRKSGDGEIPQKHFIDLVTGENKPKHRTSHLLSRSAGEMQGAIPHDKSLLTACVYQIMRYR